MSVAARLGVDQNAMRFKPLGELRCRECLGRVNDEGSIFSVVGADVWAWCCPAHAARSGLWPWKGFVHAAR
jgi:hypothetical protein